VIVEGFDPSPGRHPDDDAATVDQTAVCPPGAFTEDVKRFFGAVRGGDRATVQHHLRDFVMPYIGIRNRAKGYAVSIVKAGCALVGRPAGKVRAPLTDLKPADIEDLRQLIERAQRLA